MISTHAPNSSAIAAVRTDNLSKIYGEGETAVHALRNVSVAFADGEFTGIMGASGSGKSTLLHCIAGLDTITSGHIWIADTQIDLLGDTALTKLRREHVGFVFQSFNLLPTETAYDNIVLPLKLAGRKPDEQYLTSILSILGIGDRLDHLPSQLSGGQQQRVAVARALVTRPKVIFADEPTGALDSSASAELMTFLRRSVDELGQTIVMVTHDPNAAAYADRVLTLADGRIVNDQRKEQ